MGRTISTELQQTLQADNPFFEFLTRSEWARRVREEGICDFVTGEPHEMALPGVVEAIKKWAEPRDPHWFGYKTSDAAACAIAALSLSTRLGAEFNPEQIFLTNGAISALTVAFHALVDPGDEVIYLSPPWFGYEPMIIGRGATPVRVQLTGPSFDLDVPAVAAAVTRKTRAVIVNSPNNPTGKIYSAEMLAELGVVLEEASVRNDRPVYLISDEAYSRVLFDGNRFTSPALHYSKTLVIYTYGKTLLMPGARIGFIALAPGMPEADLVGEAIFMSQIQTGWSFPNALLQHAIGDLEMLSIDLTSYQKKRDRMVEALRSFGYELTVPEGTFYVLVRSPIDDDLAFIELLARRDIFVLPGSTTQLPGYFRISLTATMEMIERSLTGFEAALQETKASG